MPIAFNPFEPAYQNVLLPLANSLAVPYTNLVKYSIIPTYSLIVTKARSYEEGVEKFNSIIKTALLIVQIAVFFFLYQKAWSFGMQYFGLALGPLVGGAVCTIVYGVGYHALDQHLNNRITTICTISWLHYRGSISLIESLGTNREGALAALLISGFLGLKHQHIDQTKPDHHVKPFRAAQWLAQCFFDKPLSQRFDSDQTIDGTQNLSDRERV
jgi:hypothetical protein